MSSSQPIKAAGENEDVGDLRGWWGRAAQKVIKDDAAKKVLEVAAAKRKAFDEKLAEREQMWKEQRARERRDMLAMELRKKEEKKIREEAWQKSVLEYNAKKKIEEREFNKKVFFEASRMQDEAEKDDAKKRKGNYPRSTQ